MQIKTDTGNDSIDTTEGIILINDVTKMINVIGIVTVTTIESIITCTTIKDIIPRYMAMRGHYVQRRFGWDCHGLPIEALAQEALGLAGAGAIKEAGIDVFNEKCRSMVLTYVNEWRKTVTR